MDGFRYVGRARTTLTRRYAAALSQKERAEAALSRRLDSRLRGQGGMDGFRFAVRAGATLTRRYAVALSRHRERAGGCG